MHRGEVLALRWGNIDLDAATLSVVETLERTNAGLRFKPPKTQKGRRVVALGSTVVDVLRRHRAEQLEARTRLGAPITIMGLVVAHEDGRPWEPYSFTTAFRAFGRAFRGAEVP